MKRALLWILGSAAVLAVAAFILFSRMDANFVVRQIADATAKATGQPLRFDSPPGISFFPPGVQFGQAHWGDVNDGQSVAISVKGGMAQVELSPLLSGNVVVREVRLDSPVVDVRQHKAASPADPKTEKHAKPSSPAADAAPKGAAQPAELPIELKRLVLRQGAVTYTTADGKVLRVDDVNLSVENLRNGQEAVVQCDFAFAMTDRAPAGTAKTAQQTTGNMTGTLAFSTRVRYAPPQLVFRQTALTVTPLTGALPKEVGPVQLTCEGSLRLSDMHLQLNKAQLNTPQARLSVSGEAVLTQPSFNGSVEVEGTPSKLAALTGNKLQIPTAKDDLRFRSMVRYSANAVNFSQLFLQLDDISVRGGLRLDLPENAPLAVTADIQTSMINLDPFLPQADSGAQAAEAPAAGGASAKPDAEAARRMPGLDIRAKLAGISKGNLQVKDIALAIKGEKGRYALTTFNATLGTGGSIKSTGNMDMAVATCAIKAQAADVDLGPLLVALGKGRQADGLASLDADLTMKCADANDIRKSLSGRGTVEARNLYLPAMEELSKSVPSLPGRGGPLRDRFDLARASFTARNGEIDVTPITVTSASVAAGGKAHISLPRQHLDGSVSIRTLGLTIPVFVRGPLNDISYGVDSRFFDAAKNLPANLFKTGRTAGGNAGERIRGILGR